MKKIAEVRPIRRAAVLVPIVVIVPIAYYPFSKTLWMAIDHAFLQRLGR